MGADFLKDIDIDEILPSFFDRSVSNVDALKIKRITLPERWRFLNVFISYLAFLKLGIMGKSDIEDSLDILPSKISKRVTNLVNSLGQKLNQDYNNH